MSGIQQEIQKLDPSAIIWLFELDASVVGGPVLRFTQNAHVSSKVQFQGLEYEPIDIEFQGLETSGVGAQPTPSLQLAKSTGLIQALINTYGDLNGCKLSRLRTFARFLDGQPEADPNAFFGPDAYSFERKVSDTAESVEWELATSLDQEDVMIPGRIIVRNTCMWRYRIFDQSLNGGAGGFKYDKAQCPYAGLQSYDVNNQPVTDDKDAPSRTIECCRTRFGSDQPLPFGGFPGVQQT